MIALISSAVLGAALLCVILTVLAAKIPFLIRRNDLRAVQATHTKQVARLGGVGIMGTVAGLIWLLPEGEARTLALLLCLSTLPVFLAGLAEDLGYGVPPGRRLVAAMVAALLAVVLLQVWIRGTGLMPVDWALGLLPLAIGFTIFWSMGLCHSMNLIDGMNGLAASFTILASAALGVLAFLAGDSTVMLLCALLGGASLGFLTLNWPQGRLFLGDAGAYSLGHMLSWLGILLAWRNPEVAGAAIALILFWPIVDSLFAVYRRRRLGKRFDQPDRLHIHQLTMRWLELSWLGRQRHITNPLTTVVLLPFMGLPMIAGIVFATEPYWGFLAFVALVVAFVGTYAVGMRLARQRRNPIDAIRPVPTVVAEAANVENPTLVEPRPGIRLMRPSERDTWHAMVQTDTGIWLRLDRGFRSRDRAYRAAVRTQMRNRVFTPEGEAATP